MFMKLYSSTPSIATNVPAQAQVYLLASFQRICVPWKQLKLNLETDSARCICNYIYIYTYTCMSYIYICMYVYIYIYMGVCLFSCGLILGESLNLVNVLACMLVWLAETIILLLRT